jgi:hypothetical protein
MKDLYIPISAIQKSFKKEKVLFFIIKKAFKNVLF